MTNSKSLRFLVFAALVTSILSPEVRAEVGETVKRSSCYELRVEAISFAGYIVGAIQVQWSVKVVGGEPSRPPKIRVLVGGDPVEERSSGLKTIVDSRRYEQGALKFGSSWLTQEARDKGVKVVVEQLDRPECSVDIVVNVPVVPEIKGIDLHMIADAYSMIGESKQNHEGSESNRGKQEFGEALKGVVSRELSGPWQCAVEENRPIVMSELFREYVYYRDGFWSTSEFGPGPIDNWKRDVRFLSGAVSDFHQRRDLLSLLNDPALGCVLMVRYSGVLAKYGPSSDLDEALAIARKSCDPFAASIQMLDAIELVAHGKLERNSHGWLEVPANKAKME